MHFLGFLDQSMSLRFNLHDNLDKLRKFRSRAILPVRSNIDDFADNFVAVEDFNTSFSHSFNPDLHLIASMGNLEEMYSGLGGEVLYRPFNKRYAFGAELWQAFKRDPDTFLNLGVNGDHILSGHVNGWYHIPRYDAKIKASVGRYLAGDIGGDLTLSKTFKNGATMEGFVTMTDQADIDAFGSAAHAYQGIRIQVPLGGFRYIPQNTTASLTAEPLGRDTGQRLDAPYSLYETTDPFSKDHMVQHWGRVLDSSKSAIE